MWSIAQKKLPDEPGTAVRAEKATFGWSQEISHLRSTPRQKVCRSTLLAPEPLIPFLMFCARYLSVPCSRVEAPVTQMFLKQSQAVA